MEAGPGLQHVQETGGLQPRSIAAPAGAIPAAAAPIPAMEAPQRALTFMRSCRLPCVAVALAAMA